MKQSVESGLQLPHVSGDAHTPVSGVGPLQTLAPRHRRFLRFVFKDIAYQFMVMPFGLRHSVSVHGDAVRAIDWSDVTYIYEMCGCGTFPSESEWNMHIKLFERLTGLGPFGGCAQQLQMCSFTSPGEVRSLCEQTKKCYAPASQSCI